MATDDDETNCTAWGKVVNSCDVTTPDLYCDYGPLHSAGGGCFGIRDASECNTEYGIVANSCGRTDLRFCDYGPIQPNGDGGCFPMNSTLDETNCMLNGTIVTTCNITASSSSGSIIHSSSSTSGSDVCPQKHYLGKGYDVIRSSYINHEGIKHTMNIIDQDKMCQDGFVRRDDEVNIRHYKAFTGKSIKGFNQDRNTNIGFGFSFGSGALFSLGLSKEFETSQSSDEQTYYSRIYSYLYKQFDYIVDGKSNLPKYLTDSFKNDLKNKSASAILNDYGTHVFISYYKGGCLEANYTYWGTSLKTTEAVRTAVDGSYKTISANLSTGSNKSEIDKEENTSFNYKSYGGGIDIKALGIDALKGEHGKWLTSITSGNAEICGIQSFDDSFISIWDLAKAAGETSKAADLEKAFRDLATSQLNDTSIFPLGKIFEEPKSVTYAGEAKGTISLSNLIPTSDRTKATIANIEIYALGAGGGGQGGHNNVNLLSVTNGMGGAGGGGSASYLKLSDLKLNKGQSVTLDVNIGRGGPGGTYIQGNIGDAVTAGCNGGDGATTTVKYGNITITAPGGKGGYGNSNPCKIGGGFTVNGGNAGNRGTITDATVPAIFVQGTAGSDGVLNIKDGDKESRGGNSGRINSTTTNYKGTLNSFGGYSGMLRSTGGAFNSTAQANCTPTNTANCGGGGHAGFLYGNSVSSGKKGGDGLVTVVIRYFVEE
jgi:hypothetical protein